MPIHVHDLQASAHEFPDGAEYALRFGHRTILAVPLLRDDEAIGALMIRRTEVKPFTDKQIELATAFADQAVIAIELRHRRSTAAARQLGLSAPTFQLGNVVPRGRHPGCCTIDLRGEVGQRPEVRMGIQPWIRSYLLYVPRSGCARESTGMNTGNR